jgi:oligopeptide/dipeptide ABC transporter ATP-binding protein
VIAEMCDAVAVMYAGRIVERGPVIDIFEQSRHPYTKGLLESVPRRGVAHKSALPTIEGVVPSMLSPPAGCRFAERCRRHKLLAAEDRQRCLRDDPAPQPAGNGWVACHFPLAGGAW